MPVGVDVLAFVLGALVSLTSSWLLITRLERVGRRLGLTEGILGLVAALAADTPEISSAVTALVHGERAVGTGVVLGSNVFNLAALLGLAAVVAGWVPLHRRVVLLSGSVALWVAVVSLLTLAGALGAPAGLALVFVVVVAYAGLLATHTRRDSWPVVPRRLASWMQEAISEEEEELYVAIHPRRGRANDVWLAAIALALVVGASAVMERAGSSLGNRYGVPEALVGALLLAAVTSLPNAVAAGYLASRGRGAAMLSTASNSNTLNVLAGLLLPAVLLGVPSPDRYVWIEAAWYLGLTGLAMGLAYLGRGLGRLRGLAIIAAYLAFVAALLAA